MLLLLFAAGCGPTQESGDDAGVDGGVPHDAGVTTDAGTGTDAGFTPDAGFCAPCIEQATCGAGNLCLGETGHCALDCETAPCPTGTVCTAISRGKISPLHQCLATASACGTLAQLPASDCTDGWTNFADGFFETRCRGCHTGGFTTLTDVRAQTDSLRLAIDQRNMPLGVTLPDAERLRILTWLSCGSASPPSGVR